MTGFGRSEYSDEFRRVVIEMKSVNHRYCDIGVKLPRSISRFEPEIRKRLKKYVEREGIWTCKREEFIELDYKLFPEVTFENSPQKVEIKLMEDEH